MIQLDRIRRLGQSLPPTDRQLAVLRAYLNYGTLSDAAQALDLSERTLKNHLAALRQRLGVQNTAQAVYVLWLGYRDHLSECGQPTHDGCIPMLSDLSLYR